MNRIALCGLIVLLAGPLAAIGSDAAKDPNASARTDSAEGRDTDKKIDVAKLVDPMWVATAEVPRPPRKGKERKPGIAHLWIPPDCEKVRGVIFSGKTLLEKKFSRDKTIRKAAAMEDLGIVYVEPALDAVFSYVKRDSGERLEKVLADLAKKTGHEELAGAPLITVGHSTGGIFARNVAYWKPHRVAGIIHIKSGNMHHHIPDPNQSLAGVPFLAINGEWEEYGPEGGIRKELGRETQWIMIRQQMLALRKQDPNHLMNLVVHHKANHTSWSGDLSEYCALWICKAAQARIPEKWDKEGPVHCKEIDVASGWLTDASIKDPEYDPAPYDKYKGPKDKAFWHFDEEAAKATVKLHKSREFRTGPEASKKKVDPLPVNRN